MALLKIYGFGIISCDLRNVMGWDGKVSSNFFHSIQKKLPMLNTLDKKIK